MTLCRKVEVVIIGLEFANQDENLAQNISNESIKFMARE